MKARVLDWKAPDYRPIFTERARRLDRIRADGAWNHAFAYYKSRPVEAMEDWLVTYDPRKVADGKPAYMPFVLFDKQREFITWTWDRYRAKEDGLVEKSRDGGASWLCLGFAWWLWTFHPGTTVLFGSRKEILVDRLGDPNSLFQKLRIMLKMLPRELRPYGYDPREHEKYMNFVNPENGSAIVGEAGKYIGRGGRSSIAFVDEAAFLEYAEEVDSALSENCDSKFWVSTPNLPGDWFSRRRFSGQMKVFTLHWQDDPRKDQKWYEDRVRRLEPEVVAREIDLDYDSKASDLVCPGQHIRSSIRLRKLLERAKLLPARGEEGVAGLDVGAGGTGKSVLVPRFGAVVDAPHSWSDEDTINTAGRAQTLAFRLKCDLIQYDSIGVGKGVGAAFKRMTIAFRGVNVGDKPTRTRWEDGKKAREKFTNLKAELWWTVRDRLRRSHELWLYITTDGEKGCRHELADCILLPDVEALRTELGQPRFMYLESGKVQIESKRQMAARGVASPDHAEALILTYAPRPRRKGTGRAAGLW